VREAFPDFTDTASGAHPGAFSLCLGLADRERRRRGAGGHCDGSGLAARGFRTFDDRLVGTRNPISRPAMSISESMPNGSRVLACRGRHAG